MARPEKVSAVGEIKDRVETAKAVFLAEYAGLSVKEQQALRRGLRAGGAEFKVVKMTLAKRAMLELDVAELDELLVGPTGLTFADTDAVTAAKTLKDFARDHDRLVIKGGLLGREFLAPEKISELAEIEPREVLLAKFAGAAKAPLANFAGMMGSFTRDLATMLQQLIDKAPDTAPPPVEDASDPGTAEADDAEAPDAPEPEASTEGEASDIGEAEAPEAEEADTQAPEASDGSEDAASSEDSADAEGSADAENTADAEDSADPEDPAESTDSEDEQS